jgi:DNA-3-methyladenine glycosylase II
VQKAYGLESRPKPKQVEEIGAKWRPYASYAAWYLWRSLE